MSLRTRAAFAALLPLLAACGRSDMFGDVNGGFTDQTSGGFSAGSAGSGSGGSGTSAGFETNGTVGATGNDTNGTAGSGATSAGQGVSGISSGTTSDVGSSNSGSRGSGTTAGFTSGTGGTSGMSSSGRSTGTGGTGSTGKASGTTGSGTTTGPACDAKIAANLQAACTTDSDCGCPYLCQDDPPYGKDCEPSCLQLADCGDLGYVCNGTYCQFNECGGKTGNGSFNSTCNVAGTDDGTCIPFSFNGTTIGQCFQGGTSTTCCDGTATRTATLSDVCVAGSICSGGPGNSGECGEVCDPNKRHPCSPGLFCAVEVGDEITGGCFGEESVCPQNG